MSPWGKEPATRAGRTADLYACIDELGRAEPRKMVSYGGVMTDPRVDSEPAKKYAWEIDGPGLQRLV